WSVDYGRITPLIVKAVQELKALVDGLVAKVEKLYAMVMGHEEAIRKLQAANDNLERANTALVKRIDALERKFRAANDNDVTPVLKKAVGLGPEAKRRE